MSTDHPPAAPVSPPPVPCPKCAADAKARAEADAWAVSRPKCRCGRATWHCGYALRCLGCDERTENCPCASLVSPPGKTS